MDNLLFAHYTPRLSRLKGLMITDYYLEDNHRPGTGFRVAFDQHDNATLEDVGEPLPDDLTGLQAVSPKAYDAVHNLLLMFLTPADITQLANKFQTV